MFRIVFALLFAMSMFTAFAPRPEAELQPQENIPFEVAPIDVVFAGSLGRQAVEVKERRLGDMLVVEKRLGVVDRAVIGLADVVPLAHMVVPVDALGEKAMWSVMMLGGRTEDHQPVELKPPAGGRR